MKVKKIFLVLETNVTIKIDIYEIYANRNETSGMASQNELFGGLFLYFTVSGVTL